MKWFIVEISLVLLIAPAAAHADEVTVRQIVGGQLATNSTTGQFEIVGEGFDLQGRADVSANLCQPCQAGRPATLIAFNEVRTLSGTVGGVVYPKLVVGNSFLGIPSALNVGATASIVIPFDAVTGTQLTFPFETLLARFVGYPDTSYGVPLFDLSLAGAGTATVTVHRDGVLDNGTPIFTGTEITWAFGAAPSPTPEPATILLVGTALVGILARGRRSPGVP